MSSASPPEEQIAQLHQQASQLVHEGRHEAALIPARRAWELAQRYLAATDLLLESCAWVLARLCHRTGHFTEAEPLYRRCLQLQRAAGEDQLHYLETLAGLGWLYATAGLWTRAEPVCRMVVEVRRRTVGEQHPDFAAALGNLAAVTNRLGRLAEAEALHRQALEVRRAALGADHPEVADSLRNLATVLVQQGRLAEAEPLCRQALEVRRRVLGEDHPDLAQDHHNLAEVCSDQGKHAEAEAAYLQALDLRRRHLPPDHPDLASTLHDLGKFYVDRLDGARAEPLLREAVAIRRRTLPADNPVLGWSLQGLGTACARVGKFAEAEALYREVIEVRRRAPGGPGTALARALDDLAGVYRAIGRYAEAEPLYREAAEIYRGADGGEGARLGRQLHQLAEVCRERGDFAQSERLCHEALDVLRRAVGEGGALYSSCLVGLAHLLDEKGDQAEAERLYLQVLQRSAGDGTADALGRAKALHNLAILYAHWGRDQEAEARYLEALEVRRRTVGEDHPDNAGTLGALALLRFRHGDFGSAEALLRRSEEIDRRAYGTAHPSYAVRLVNLAALHRELGDWAENERLLRQALDILRRTVGEDSPLCIKALSNLAIHLHHQGERAEAIRLHGQVLALRRRVLGERHPDVAGTLICIGSLCNELGCHDEAVGCLQKAIEILGADPHGEHPDLADALNNLGCTQQNRGNLPEAERLYRESLRVLASFGRDNTSDYSGGLHNLGTVLVVQGRPGEALDCMLQAQAVNDRLLGRLLGLASERQRLQYLQTLRGGLDQVLTVVTGHLAGSPPAVRAALDLVLRRKGLAAEALAAQRDAILAGRYPHLRPQLERLTALRRQVAQKTLAGPDPEQTPEAHRRVLTGWTVECEELERTLGREVTEVGLAQRLKSADRRAVALALPEGVALVEFVRFSPYDFTRSMKSDGSEWLPDRYLGFVLPAGDPDAVRLLDLGEAAPLDHLIAEFRASITGETDSQRRDLDAGAAVAAAPPPPSDAGEALRQVLLEPLLPALAGRARLLLAPEGDLSRLPFEVLPLPGGGHLIDAWAVSYLTCGRDVLRFAAGRTSQPAAPVVVGDPAFDLSASAPCPEVTPPDAGRQARDLDAAHVHFSRLPGTRAEGDDVASLLGVQPWLEAEALEGRLKAVRSPRILHLATHGFFLEDRKTAPAARRTGQALLVPQDGLDRLAGASGESPLLRSGLALAGANTWLSRGPLPAAAEDGILTAEDVSGLDLTDTELVVLSACETGLGHVRVGEGVFGLRRAFVLAGARSLVMSLWKVPDQQTQELMHEFYRRLLAGQPRAEALRQAQRALQASYPEPFYWGAFICQGDPAALPPA